MKTLYDLLGALAEDDADGIRAAFRKAAKANHPDNNPDDQEAALRFRQIVRANAILSDRRQREAYDRMLAIALRQRTSKPKRGNFSRRSGELAFGAISGAIFSAVSIGIYLLFGHMFAESLARNPVSDALVNAPAAAITAGPSGDLAGHHTTGLAGTPKVQAEIRQASRHALEESSQQEAAKKPEAGPAEAITPGAATAVPSPAAPPATDAADAKIDDPPQDAVVKDARYYRERGMQAYRSGDLPLALIDFDLAIDLDPNFSDTYIDRAIVLHRMGDFMRAFEDVARAKRIDDSKGKHALSAQ